MNEFYVNCMTGEVTETAPSEYPVKLTCTFEMPGNMLLLHTLIKAYSDLPATPMSVKFIINGQ